MSRELKPKLKESVSLPEDLRVFLCEVHQQIENGNKAALNESDDILQSEMAYGGLTKQGSTLYGFTYFSGEYADTKVDDAASWELLLNRSEIADIAQRHKSKITLWACQAVQWKQIQRFDWNLL